MTRLLWFADDILRGRASASISRSAGAAILCGFFYGAVMGTFGGVTGQRVWQVLFSAVKLPLLLAVTFFLVLPSFFVLNTLLGVRSDFPQVFRALVTSQTGLTITLACLAPYTSLWYVSFPSYPAATLFNAFLFTVASLTGQVMLWRCYRPLAARHRGHRWLFRMWLILYAFVGIQMGWVLRPFLGAPDLPVQFFRERAWGNAYVVVAQILRDAFLH